MWLATASDLAVKANLVVGKNGSNSRYRVPGLLGRLYIDFFLSQTFFCWSSTLNSKPNMANDIRNNLSEQLQLLHELNYSDLDMSCQDPGIHSNKLTRNVDTNRDVRFLDVISAAVTTGNPGDVFAAAFDKRKRMELVEKW